MVRFVTATGNAVAQRNARGKHCVVFDLPRDKGQELKRAQPDIGWFPEDVDGFPTLPYSVAARLILPPVCMPGDRGVLLFSQYVTDQLLDRVWGAIIPYLDLYADDIFDAVNSAADTLTDQTPLYSVAGDWRDVEGVINGDRHARWLTAITRGDAFKATPGGKPGLAAAELFYYLGSFFRPLHRADNSHFATTARTLGKLLASDDDEDVVDAAQLASDVAGGLLESEWPIIFMTVPPSSDSVVDAAARGGERIADLRARIGYFRAHLSSDESATKFVVRTLPRAMKRILTIPAVAAVFQGADSGVTIAEGLARIATQLGMASPREVDDRALRECDRLLAPMQHLFTAEFRATSLEGRLQLVLDKIDTLRLSAKNASSPPSTAADDFSTGGAASGKLLLTQLTKPDALFQLERLRQYRLTSEYDPVSFLEIAHSGRLTPELRAEKKAAAEKLPAGAAKRDALQAIVDDDLRAPLPALMQLVWGHVKTLEGYPELQDVYDLGQTHLADVVGRLCARAYSADGQSIPAALRFARATKLTAELRTRAWGGSTSLHTDANFVDFSTNGDAVMLSYIKGGDGENVTAGSKTSVYTDISQLIRVRRLGANVLAFFGIRDGATQSWRQLVASCEHAHMSVPASDQAKRTRLGRAMRTLVLRALGDVGKRIDLIRYSAKHDAIVPRDLLPKGRGGAMDEFAEGVQRLADDQKRERGAAADDDAVLASVRLPAEMRGSLATTATSEQAQKRQRLADMPPLSQDGTSDKSVGSTTLGKPEPTRYTALTLAAKPKSGKVPEKITIDIDAKGAQQWLANHGVRGACLKFQFGHVGKTTRRWASCDKQSNAAHGEQPEGPHAIADGWAEAAVKFVKPADRNLLGF